VSIDQVPSDVQRLAGEALVVAQDKVRVLMEDHPDYLPLYTKDGRWKHDLDPWTNWCEGFLGGQMWIFADQTGSPEWRTAAEHYSRLLSGRQFDRDVHDLGFLFWPTWKRWHTLTDDRTVDEVVVQAGKTMALRLNDKAGFLRSFLAQDSTFIDIMMNVGIIFYAAERTGDDDLRRVADTHCLNTRRHLIRGDGSSAHEGIFDLDSGEFLRQSTQQGWRSDSSWARGQAWALYGFGTCFAFTGDARYLDTAMRCADYYIANTDEDGVPPNDWQEPSPEVPFESSAAAIAASGLLQLAALTDGDRSTTYRDTAFSIVRTLCGSDFLATEEDIEGVLKHGSYHETRGLGVDECVMWGEYFFAESLDKCLGGEWVATER